MLKKRGNDPKFYDNFFLPDNYFLNFLHNSKKKLAYSLAFSLTLIFIYVKVYFKTEIGVETPFLLLITPVVLSAWIGGLGPGIFATILSVFSSYYFFSQHTIYTDNIFLDLRSYLFLLEGLLISLVSEARGRSDSLRINLLELEREARFKAEKATERSQYLSEVSRILSGSIDYKETLESVVKLLVPKMADWCIVDVLIDGKFQRLAVIHKNPELQKYADELKRKFPPDIKSPGGPGQVLRTGKALIYPKIMPSVAKVSTRNNPEILSISRKLGFDSMVVMPLVSSQKKVLGAICFITGGSGKQYRHEDVMLFHEIAGRVSLAVDNALLYRKSKEELRRRKKIEEQLRNSRDQLQVILQNAADGIIVQTAGGKLIYVNDNAAQETGFKNASEMLNAGAEEIASQFALFDERERPLSPMNLPGNRALKGEKNPEELIHYRNIKTGEERWSLVKARPVLDSQGKVLFAISIFHDITARKLLDNQKDTFIGMVSHELKTPVTTIKAYAQLLNKNARRSRTKEILAKVDDQLNRVNLIINDLMDIAQIRSGQFEFQDSLISIDSLVKQAVDDIAQTQKSHIFEIVGATKCKILADRNRIYQVITNLLSNAAKYSPGKNKVLINLKCDKKNLTLSVTDFGIGIPKESQLKIFSSFSRISSAKTKNIPGTGLGLYISTQIIKHYKGKIWVESELGKGSTFSFSLPIKNT